MMRRSVVFILFVLALCTESVFAQRDTVEVKVNNKTGGQCCWNVIVKNRNTQSKAIDEIQFQIQTLDGTIFEDVGNVTQWTANFQDLDASYVAQVNPIAPGATKSDFLICLGITATSFDKPINVKWVTINSTTPIDSGLLQLICTPTQGYVNDSVSVVTSLSGTDPCFTFTVFAKNEYGIPISRFAAKLVTPDGGVIRPSKVTPPAGWVLDSVVYTVPLSTAYFRASSPNDYIFSGDNKGGFKVCLRGNPQVTSFNFAWFTYDDGNVLVSRDTVRDAKITFTGFAAEIDSVRAQVFTGCLYDMTVKNYHVTNLTPPSRIRRVALWRKSNDVTFLSAPAGPSNWTRTVKADSIIYYAPHDSMAIPSGIVNSQFRFSVDAPSSSFKLGWRTWRTASYADTLSSGELTLQCVKEQPRNDTAYISGSISECVYTMRVFNQHNTPPSNISAIRLSIPPGKGKLHGNASSLGWTSFTNVTDTSFTVVAPTGGAQQTGVSQEILFELDPTTPGERIPIRWATFDDAALQANTPLFTGQDSIGCTPPVLICDTVTYLPVAASKCTYDYSVNNRRSEVVLRMVFQTTNGWQIESAETPTGWNVQLLNNKTTAEYTATTASGVQPGATKNGFIIQYIGKEVSSDSFKVSIARYDEANIECADEHWYYTCTSEPKDTSSVNEAEVLASSVQIIPNPTRSDSRLVMTVDRVSRVTVTALDVLGKEVRRFSSAILQPGSHEQTISLQGLEAGSYYIRIQSNSGVVTKRIVYMP